MTSTWKRTLLALGALLVTLPFAAVASGQAADEYGDVSDVGPNAIAQTVARISNLQGDVSYARGDQPDEWQPADLNIPMTLGDRIYTGKRSRVELQVQGGDAVWVGSGTDLTALNLTTDTKQFALKSGIASFRVRQLDENDVWEVDTPNSAVTFERAGDYRIEVSADGNTRVTVKKGSATVAAGGGQIALNEGEGMAIDGIDSPRYDVFPITSPDRWDSYVDTRLGRYRRSASYQYVSQDVVGADDLDDYGSWDHIPEYGMAWAPARVEVGWTPYRLGHWAWQDPWGWTWISTEPWGWAPYHYGRWVTYSSRWYWIPEARSVRVAYAPALVAFVGGGPGFAGAVTIGGGGYVGWFPLAPREPLIAWWAPRPAVNVNVTNVTYINKTYVTIVNQNTFVSGGVVARNVVTDRTVIRQVAATPVVRGVVPVIPTAASTRLSARGAISVPRPPAASLARPVVARVAPPPAPPRFDQKLAAIRENRAPVRPDVAARMATQSGQLRAATAVRPVVAEPGRVSLAPRSGASTSTRTQAAQPVAPVAPVRGRPLATSERPVAAGPVTGTSRSAPAATSPESTGPATNRPGAPDQRPTVERERAAPSQPESPATRPQTERDRAPAPAPRDERLSRPTPNEERPTRPESPRAQPPQTQQRSERPMRPTPSGETPQRPQSPEGRVRPEKEAAPTPAPAWRERARPTAKDERPSREAAPPPERARPERERVVTPPPSREVVRPDGRAQSDDRQKDSRANPPKDSRARTPRPKPTPEG